MFTSKNSNWNETQINRSKVGIFVYSRNFGSIIVKETIVKKIK